MTSASEAVHEAKGFFDRPQDEPLVPNDLVLLREVVQALEILWGYSDEVLSHGIDTAAHLRVLQALNDRELEARAFDDRREPVNMTLIPAVAWRKPKSEDPESDPLSSFWIGKLRYDDCDGFGGELPVVLRADAENWLKKARKDRAPVRHTTTRDLEKAFMGLVKDYPEGTRPLPNVWDAWWRRNCKNREQANDLRRRLAPQSWRKPGRAKD